MTVDADSAELARLRSALVATRSIVVSLIDLRLADPTADRGQLQSLRDQLDDLSSGPVQLPHLEVSQLTVVDPSGNARVRLTNGAEDVRGAGLIFYDDDGAECGALLYRGTRGPAGPDAASTFSLGPTGDDAETALFYRESDGHWAAGFRTARTFLGHEDGVARLVLHDREGRPRLRLAVAEDGAPSVQLLDEQGTVTHEVP